VVVFLEGLLHRAFELAGALLAGAAVQVQAFGELLEHLTDFHLAHRTRGLAPLQTPAVLERCNRTD
jgi:hypothetical protein